MKPLLIAIFSVAVLVGIWWLGSMTLPSSVLPSPFRVAAALWVDMQSIDLWVNIGISLLRIAAAFSIAMVSRWSSVS
jgi:ABC-type nitrate/sulfonate/bicarbonate transport system, permease component